MVVAPKDYSLLGIKVDKSFHAIGSMATIAFAFNSNILLEMHVNSMHSISYPPPICN